METRANYVLIGAFTLAAVVGAFLFVMWIAGYGRRAATGLTRLSSTARSPGLSNGANVSFNGIKVGEVTHLTFSRSDPHQVVADIDVSSDAPIDRNTKARLETAGAHRRRGGRPARRVNAGAAAGRREWPGRRSSTPDSRCSCRTFWTASAPSRSEPRRFWTTPTRSSPTIPRRSIRRSRMSIMFSKALGRQLGRSRRGAEERGRTRQADRAARGAPANPVRRRRSAGSVDRYRPRFARSWTTSRACRRKASRSSIAPTSFLPTIPIRSIRRFRAPTSSPRPWPTTPPMST